MTVDRDRGQCEDRDVEGNHLHLYGEPCAQRLITRNLIVQIFQPLHFKTNTYRRTNLTENVRQEPALQEGGDELKRNGERADEHVGQCEIRDEHVRYVPHFLRDKHHVEHLERQSIVIEKRMIHLEID